NIAKICGNLNFSIHALYISSTAVDQFNNNIYTSTPLLSNVSIFNSTTCSITDSIEVGSIPINITVDQKTGYVYVVNEGSNNISVIDPTTEKIISSINVGSSPDSSIYDPINNLIYVANEGSNNISVINTISNKVLIPSINVGNDPKHMIFVPQNNLIYVDYLNSNNISVINTTTNTIVKTIGMPNIVFNTPSNMAYCAKTESIYVLGYHSNISIISTNSNDIIKTIYPYGLYTSCCNISLDPSNNTLMLKSQNWRLYVMNLSTDTYISYIQFGWYEDCHSMSRCELVFASNPYSNMEFGLQINPNGAINVYSFNVINPNHQAPLDLFPIIVIVSIVSVIAIVIIWRKSVDMKYKDYTG
ncbi:hypothetical protein B1A_14458, partial [mine drainage metagenome]